MSLIMSFIQILLSVGFVLIMFSGCDQRHYTYITTGETEVIIATVPVNIPVIIPSTTTIIIPVPKPPKHHKEH